MNLSPSDLVLLRAIQAHDGTWNWYQLCRATLGDLGSPADLSLKALRELGCITSIQVEGEQLPRLRITEEGTGILKSLELGPGGASRE